MKKETGIWIDGSKAIIIKLSTHSEKVIEIKSNIENRVYHMNEGKKGSFFGSHHVNNEKVFEERKKNQTRTFLNNILEEIKDDDAYYVFGPAELKIKLKQAIENDQLISSKLIKVDTAEDMTINQLIAQVKKTFNHS